MSEPPSVDTLTVVMLELFGVDGRVLFGAMLGSLLVSAVRGRLMVGNRRRPTITKRMLLVMLSAGVGYLFAPLLESLAPMFSQGMAAFAAAVVVIPISLKVMVWLETLDLRDIVQRWRN